MTKILITGGSGLLGSKLIELSDKKWDIFPTYKNNKIFHNNAFPLELKNKKAIEKLIDKIKPDLVIHTAAITNIDWAESHPNETFEINVNSTKSLLSCAKNIEADFFYISTDSVFDGEKGCYNENDIPNPINVYSKSKFEAEKIVEEYEQTTVIRTSFFGFLTFSERESFPIQILNNLIHKKPIYAAVDKINNSLMVSKLVEAIYCLYEKNVDGIFHVASTDYMNSYEFAVNASKFLGVDKNFINKITLKNIFSDKKLVCRPLNTSLNTRKASKFITLPTMKESIKILCEEYKRNVLRN